MNNTSSNPLGQCAVCVCFVASASTPPEIVEGLNYPPDTNCLGTISASYHGRPMDALDALYDLVPKSFRDAPKSTFAETPVGMMDGAAFKTSYPRDGGSSYAVFKVTDNHVDGVVDDHDMLCDAGIYVLVRVHFEHRDIHRRFKFDYYVTNYPFGDRAHPMPRDCPDFAKFAFLYNDEAGAWGTRPNGLSLPAEIPRAVADHHRHDVITRLEIAVDDRDYAVGAGDPDVVVGLRSDVDRLIAIADHLGVDVYDRLRRRI